MKKLSFILLLVVIILGCSSPQSDFIELPSIISDGMVFQQNTEVVLWGKTVPHQKVEITSSWGTRKSVRSDNTGLWKIKISTVDAGGPYELAFQTKDTSAVIHDILLGEVWLASGQSNMEMPLTGWPPVDTISNSTEEIASANYPEIRLFTVPKNVSLIKLNNCEGQWKQCTPETVANFSATAYFFGRELHKELDVPIGLIHSSWGGTPAESWISMDYLEEIPSFATFEDTLELAVHQYDSLLKWMNQLNTIPVQSTKEFYETLDFIDAQFTKLDYDDSSWPTMKVPLEWSGTELGKFDGIVCYRKEFVLPESFTGKDLTLHLGPIDDMDDTYVNGKRIGETLAPGFWKKERVYSIPADIVKSGKNILTVFVIDNVGGGGIYSSSDVTISDTDNMDSFSISGDWKFLPVAELINLNLHFFDSDNTYDSRPDLSIAINQDTPTLLFNGMIHPVKPFTIKGIIWYQGESNVGRGYQYRTLFPALIESWRGEWGQGDFPFYFVQIAPWFYDGDIPSSAAELREAQLLTMNIPKTGMVVTTDIGSLETIHPSNKQETGRRLALWALAKDYGYDSLTFSGPIFNSLDIQENKAIVHFNYADNGLMTKDGPLTFFEIAGNDRVYHPANAEISGNTVIVASELVEKPVAVRFGWRDIAAPNLYNVEGLPASPFRTDSWKRLSE